VKNKPEWDFEKIGRERNSVDVTLNSPGIVVQDVALPCSVEIKDQYHFLNVLIRNM
jgi:hypothetical protein